MKNTITLLSIIFFSIHSITVHTQCHPDDWNALKAFYNITGGDNWNDNTGWDVVTQPFIPVGCDLDQLYGVNLNDDGRVIELVLFDNGLTGILPPEIGDLEFLSVLLLTKNKIGSILPASIGQLKNLSFLSLASNDFWGLPVEIGDLENLSWLELGNCEFLDTIPSEIGNLSRLTYLGLNGNHFIGNIPPQLGKLSNLTRLHLEQNDLMNEIPRELGDLNKLEELHLDGNILTGNLPSTLGLLDSLKILDVSDNVGLSASCYYPGLALLCRPNTTVDASGTSLVPWVAFCPNPTSLLCSDCTTDERYWVGVDNNNWNNQNNWDSGCVPTEGTDVYITTTDKQINVNNNVNAEARTLFIGESNDLFIKEQGDLLVGPPTVPKDTAIVNFGRIRNRGKLSTRNTNYVSISNNGFIKNGIAGTGSTGLIEINNANKLDAIAILNKDSIENYNTINITSGGIGIQNQASFFNFKNITIDGTHNDAIFNKDGLFISQIQDFFLSKIDIKNTVGQHADGILNTGTFINEMRLDITNIEGYGIYNSDTFSTNKTITINTISQGGVVNVKNFHILPSGKLDISTVVLGLQNGDEFLKQSTFTNQGDLLIDGALVFGIRNYAILNGEEGHIDVTNTFIPLEVLAGSIFNVSSTADFID